ncbi:uncharacterized protein EV420DRAFT_1640149 [Desarmillaria tabescens]|uniref:Uncharacterized protein n=1 Tax=Armillaria tabescens TaxID=1929756 RepID=A0AA39NA36_ARMTA|nr:uncharacterized protein EV420DRAFT_1640149 [Desarmillaria tabescens]KAK0461845.1 hypothetical protein EV420DRAFT_1640149 [Desarmillaria tabescens]
MHFMSTSHHFNPQYIYCLRFKSDRSGVEDVDGSMHIIIARSLELKPIVVNILNIVARIEKPMLLINTLVSAMLPTDSCIQDKWEDYEEEVYANYAFLSLWLRPEQIIPFKVQGSAFALCIFVPDQIEYNLSLGLAYAMLRAIKSSNDSNANVVSVAYEINRSGAFAIILLNEDYTETYWRVKSRAETQPNAFSEPCYGIPIAVTPDTPGTRASFQDRVLISSVVYRLWWVHLPLYCPKSNLD